MLASIVILSKRLPQIVVSDLKKQSYRNFEIIHAKEKGIVKAMNLALEKAKGDIFIRVDEDVRIPRLWLENILSGFSRPEIGGVTGPTFVVPERRGYRDSIRVAACPPAWLTWLFDNDPFAPAKIYKCGSVSYGSNFAEKLDFEKEYQIDYLEGTNWAVRTFLLRRIGGFDESYKGVCEWYDIDAVYKIKNLGYQLKYVTSAYLWHMLEKLPTYKERFKGFGMSRLANWLRFHIRHSDFHYKKIIWFLLMLGYLLKKGVEDYVKC